MITLADLGFSMEFDGSRLEKRMEGIAKALDAGFPDAMHKTGVLLARTIDFNIKSGMKPDLSARTVRERETQEKRGKPRPVAGNYAQLRNQDQFRKAATVLRKGFPGSAYNETAKSVAAGADTSQSSPVFYALTATGKSARAKALDIPLRDPTAGVTEGENTNLIRGYVAQDVTKLVRKGF